MVWLTQCQFSDFLYPLPNTQDSGWVLWFQFGCVSFHLSYFHPFVFLFWDDNLSIQMIFIKLGMCIDTVEVWFVMTNEQISSIFELSACNMSIFRFLDNYLSKSQWIFTKLDMYIDIVESGLGLLMGKFHLFLTELSLHNRIMAAVYGFTFFFFNYFHAFLKWFITADFLNPCHAE